MPLRKMPSPSKSQAPFSGTNGWKFAISTSPASSGPTEQSRSGSRPAIERIIVIFAAFEMPKYCAVKMLMRMNAPRKNVAFRRSVRPSMAQLRSAIVYCHVMTAESAGKMLVSR